MKNIYIVIPLVSFLFVTATEKSEAGTVSFDAATNTISVVDFSSDAPATLKDLLHADRKHGWNKITHDPENNIYRINANLAVGDNAANKSYLRIGSSESPDLTLIMKGIILIRAPKKSPRRSDGRFSIRNVLLIGDEDDSNVKPTIKFDCRQNGDFGIRAEKGSGTVLKIFNSEITSNNDKFWGGWRNYCRVSEGVLLNSVFSQWFGFLFYGFPPTGVLNDALNSLSPSSISKIQDCVFKNGGVAFRGGPHYLENCRFINMKRGAINWGSNFVLAKNCIFDSAPINFGKVNGRWVYLYNCNLRNSAINLMPNTNKYFLGTRAEFPSVFELKGVRFQILDQQEKPVYGALVNIECPKDAEAVRHGISFTDENGLTGIIPFKNAIMLTIRRYNSKKDQNTETVIYDYIVKVVWKGQQIKRVLTHREIEEHDKTFILKFGAGKH